MIGRNPNGGLLPVLIKVRIRVVMPDFIDNPQKDNFHNPIFALDKEVIFSILDSTILLDFFLPRGGDRWRKTFKTLS